MNMNANRTFCSLRPAAIVVAVIASLLTAAPAHAQDVIKMARFRVKLTDGRQIEGVQGTANPDLFTGTSLAGEPLTIDRDSILTLYRQQGRQTAEGLFFGAGAGALLAIVYNSLAIDDSETGSKPAKGSSNLFFGAIAGAAIGAGIGAQIDDWKKVTIPLEWTINPDPGNLYLGLSLRF